MKITNICIVVAFFCTTIGVTQVKPEHATEALSEKAATTKFKQEVETTKTRKLPVTIDTNFDSFIEPEDYNVVAVKTLKLETIYPDFYNENYKALASFKIALSEDFYSVVVTVKKGDHEMESVLINYSTKGDILDSKVVAYDEIAEGISRIKSRIYTDKISTNYIFWTEKKEIEQKEYAILLGGKMELQNVTNLNESIDNFALINTVIDYIGLDFVTINTNLITSKALPQSTNEIIVVIPEIVDAGEHYFELNSHIILANETTGNITSKHFENQATNGWVSDALELSKITLDTAPYYIAKDTRAFGVRVHFFGSSQVNPYTNETLSLFIKSGDTLKKVLHNFNVKKFGGEWNNDCEGEFSETKKILIISQKMTNSFFDIVAKGTTTFSSYYMSENGDCETEKEVTLEKTNLKFNGNTYTAN